MLVSHNNAGSIYLRFIIIVFIVHVDYRIVIICSNEREDESYFLSKLHLFKRPFVHKPETDLQEFKKYLMIHFTRKQSFDAENVTSIVDKYVLVIQRVCRDAV